MAFGDDAWSEDELATLKRTREEGYTAGEMAAEIGTKSRNAVIGKLRRLKLPIVSGERFGRTSQKPKRVAEGNPMRAERARHVKPPRPVYQPPLTRDFEVEPLAQVEDIFIPEDKRLNLMQLTEHTCKWPIGDPLTKDFYFCGQHSLETGPYCEFHARRAFRPAEPVTFNGNKT